MGLLHVPLLSPGKYRLADGRTKTYTAAQLKAAAEQGNRQLAAGLTAPLAWMHDPDAEPQYLGLPARPGAPRPHPDAWLAKGYYGESRRFKYDPATGALSALADIPNPKDRAQFKKVGRVSPGLYEDWTDEKGVFWPGLTVAHVASTPKPVQRHLPRSTDASPVDLSHRPARAGDAYWFSLPLTATIQESDMADEKEVPDEGEGGGGDLSVIIDLLKKLDIHGLDDVADLPTLEAALKAAVHTKVGKDGAEPKAEDGAGGEGEPVSAPMMMSQALATALFGRVGELETKVRTARIAELGKRIPRDEVKALLTEATAAHLSHPTAQQFNADGTLKPTTLDIKITAYERMPLLPVAGQTHLSHPVGHPVKNPLADESAEAKEKAAAQEVKDHFARKRGGTK